MSPFKHLLLASGLLLGALLASSCGGHSSGPASPFEPTVLGGTLPGSTAGATISGTARLSGSSSGASRMTVLGPLVLVVRVVGTRIETAVDASGRFTLEGVPAGDVRLHFEGSGINATLTLPSVQAEQTVTIVVVLAGTSATLESHDGSVEDDDSADDDSEDDDSEDDDSEDDDSEDDDSEDDDSEDDDSDDK